MSAMGMPEGLAACPWLAGWTTLDLRDLVLGPLGVQVLLASPFLGAVWALDLSGAGVGDAGASAIAQDSRLASLCALDVSNAVPWQSVGEVRDLLRTLTGRGCAVRFDMVNG